MKKRRAAMGFLPALLVLCLLKQLYLQRILPEGSMNKIVRLDLPIKRFGQENNMYNQMFATAIGIE